VLDLTRQAHALTESAYQANPAVRGGAGWADKQRMLLADMALHLIQTSLKDGDIAPDKLQNNLYSILTICAQFLPEQELARYADEIIAARRERS
jgi:hypothetical protein